MPCRSQYDDVRTAVVTHFTQQVLDMCLRRGLQCHVQQKHAAAAVHCSPTLVEDLSAAIAQAHTVSHRRFHCWVSTHGTAGTVQASVCKHMVARASAAERLLDMHVVSTSRTHFDMLEQTLIVQGVMVLWIIPHVLASMRTHCRPKS